MLFFCIPVASILSLKEYWNYLFLFYPSNSPLFKCRYCSRFILMLQCPVQCPTPSRSSLNTFQTELKWVEKPQPVIRCELLQGGYHVSFIFTITVKTISHIDWYLHALSFQIAYQYYKIPSIIVSIFQIMKLSQKGNLFGLVQLVSDGSGVWHIPPNSRACGQCHDGLLPSGLSMVPSLKKMLRDVCWMNKSHKNSGSSKSSCAWLTL